ncbi:hypothetical protein DFJ74DRAFT_769015, partial [Hyaloraphidium curvatum]
GVEKCPAPEGRRDPGRLPAPRGRGQVRRPRREDPRRHGGRLGRRGRRRFRVHDDHHVVVLRRHGHAAGRAEARRNQHQEGRVARRVRLGAGDGARGDAARLLDGRRDRGRSREKARGGGGGERAGRGAQGDGVQDQAGVLRARGRHPGRRRSARPAVANVP